MELKFKDHLLWLGEAAVRYNRHHVDIDLVYRIIDEIWLLRLASGKREFLLPFSLDEGGVEAFEVLAVHSDALEFRVVELDHFGYDPNEHDPIQWMLEGDRILRRRESVFAKCPRKEFQRDLSGYRAASRRVLGDGEI